MRHPAVSFITDGLMSGRPHPRAYATYPRILGRYVREQGVLSLEEAVRKMTSLPARKIRLRNKGVIAEGYDADLVVFDPDTVIDKNSYDDPRVHPAGIAHVLVNGVFVVEDAALTGARPGRVIRDEPPRKGNGPVPWEARLTGGAIRREPRRGRPQRGAHKERLPVRNAGQP